MVRKKAECPLPHIKVLNPMTHNTWDDGRYTTYDICIETRHKAFTLSNSTVRRRFSQFSWLRKQLKSHHNTRTPPELPPKKFFSERFDDEFIQKRSQGLEEFINIVIQEQMYLSDAVVHLFLQTDLTSSELNDFVDSKLSDDFIHDLWASGGKRVKSGADMPHTSDWFAVCNAEDDSSQSILSERVLSTGSLRPNDSMSDASSSSNSVQSDPGEHQSRADSSIDSGLNLSPESTPDIQCMLLAKDVPVLQCSINCLADVSEPI